MDEIRVGKMRMRNIRDDLETNRQRFLHLEMAERALAAAVEKTMQEDEQRKRSANAMANSVDEHTAKRMCGALPLRAPANGFTNFEFLSTPPPSISPNIHQRHTPSPPTASIDVANLFQSLLKAKIITPPPSMAGSASPPLSHPSPAPSPPSVFAPKPSLADPASLKVRNNPVISMLYAGFQCSSCCTRFERKDTVAYHKHLDEHFQENRETRVRRVAATEWYPSVSEWSTALSGKRKANHEQKQPNWFEKQKMQMMPLRSDTELVTTNCVAGDDKACAACSDPLELFFDDDQEEWMLHNAVRIDGVVYHPKCHADMQ